MVTLRIPEYAKRNAHKDLRPFCVFGFFFNPFFLSLLGLTLGWLFVIHIRYYAIRNTRLPPHIFTISFFLYWFVCWQTLRYVLNVVRFVLIEEHIANIIGKWVFYMKSFFCTTNMCVGGFFFFYNFIPKKLSCNIICGWRVCCIRSNFIWIRTSSSTTTKYQHKTR